MYFLKIPFGYITLGLFLGAMLFSYLKFDYTSVILLLSSMFMFIIFCLTNPFKEYYSKNEISNSLRKKLLIFDLFFLVLIIGLIVYAIISGDIVEDKHGFAKAFGSSMFYVSIVFILLIFKATLKFLIKLAFK